MVFSTLFYFNMIWLIICSETGFLYANILPFFFSRTCFIGSPPTSLISVIMSTIAVSLPILIPPFSLCCLQAPLGYGEMAGGLEVPDLATKASQI